MLFSMYLNVGIIYCYKQRVGEVTHCDRVNAEFRKSNKINRNCLDANESKIVFQVIEKSYQISINKSYLKIPMKNPRLFLIRPKTPLG